MSHSELETFNKLRRVPRQQMSDMLDDFTNIHDCSSTPEQLLVLMRNFAEENCWTLEELHPTVEWKL
jgi:hypothetical protein